VIIPLIRVIHPLLPVFSFFLLVPLMIVLRHCSRAGSQRCHQRSRQK
jgi:hypothetical protein